MLSMLHLHNSRKNAERNDLGMQKLAMTLLTGGWQVSRSPPVIRKSRSGRGLGVGGRESY